MIVDARTLESRELFIRIREVMAEHCGREIFIEVLLADAGEAKRVKAFGAMSGCQTMIERKEGYYIVRLTGNVCCV